MKSKTVKFGYILTSIILGIIISAFIFSCKKEKTASVGTSFDYEQIGIEHNNGLDYAFDQLKEKDIIAKGSLKSSLDIVGLAESITISFCNNKSTFKFKDLNPELNRRKLITFINDKGNIKSAQIKKLYPVEFDQYLTDNQKDLLDSISKIVSSGSADVEQSIIRLSDIEKETKNKLNDAESAVILVACSIGRHSLQYWRDNYDKWMIELGGKDNTESQSNILKSAKKDMPKDYDNILYGDVSGAVGGFIYGAYVGAVSGTVIMPGVGSLTGAIVGGLGDAVVSGIMGSVAGGLWNLFN